MATGGRQLDGRSDAELVQAARTTEPDAFGALFDRWFERSWNVARNIVRQNDIAAEVAQDSMLTAWQRLDQLRDIDAFGGWLLRITRNRALNRLERERRSQAAGDDVVSGLRDRRLHEGHQDPTGAQVPPTTDTVVDLRDKQELLWAAAAALGERDASLLDLHLRHGLSPAEIAEELGVAANTAHQQLFRMRNKLGDAIGSFVLWRNGRPLCEGLAAAVSGQVAFDRSVSRAVAKHQKTCDQCSERRAALLDPTKLFASIPLVGVPLQLKVDAAAALQHAGAPVDPTSMTPSPAGGQGSQPDPIDPTPPGPEADPIDPATPARQANPIDGATTTPMTNPIDRTGPAGDGSSPSGLSGPESVEVTRSPARMVMPSHAAFGKMAVAASSLVLVGLMILALSQITPLTDLLGSGDEDAAAGSDVVAGPSRSSETETDTGSSGQDDDLEPEVGSTTDSSRADGDDEGGDDEGGGVEPVGGLTAATTTRPITTAATGADDDPSTTTETTPTTGTTGDDTTSTSDQPAETTPTTPSITEPEPPVPDPPVVVRFVTSGSSTQLDCDYRVQRTYDAGWVTENTDAVQIVLPDGSSRSGQATGGVSFCGAPGETVVLVASGPGGDVKEASVLS